MGMVNVLHNAKADRRLHRDGFVRVPLLDRASADQLRCRFIELDPPGSGFVPDLVRTDVAYGAEADRQIAEALDDAVRALFVDHEPFMHNFLCKYPGPESAMYLHQDWSYVDERRGARTYVVWVALQDILGHNGQLQVLRGSHRLDPMLRGTDLIAPWMEHTSVIEERLLSVPLAAGDCLVFDNALVHSSHPNNTSEPRIAAAVGCKPAGVPLAYFRRGDGDRALRYEIDPEFFLTALPQELLRTAPDLPVAEVLPAGGRDLDEAALAMALDRGILARLDRWHRSADHSST
jgi:hypothetical protein